MFSGVSRSNMSRRKQLNPQQMHESEVSSVFGARTFPVELSADEKHPGKNKAQLDCSFDSDKDALVFSSVSTTSTTDCDTFEVNMRLTNGEDKENIAREKIEKEEKHGKWFLLLTLALIFFVEKSDV